VEATVYFKNNKGNVIFEKTYALVSDSTYFDLEGRGPLKPGYLKEMARDKYYTIDSVLSEWEKGNASIEITKLEFVDTKA
jgi:hypothetical protein